jgi:cystathionine beta-lyase
VTDKRIVAENREVLLARHSQKWRLYPNDVIAMHVAEMDYPVAEPIRRVLGEMVANSDMGYLGPIPELAPAFVNFAKRRWGWEPDTTGAKQAADVGVATVEYLRHHRVRKVIVTSPVYSGFWKWLHELDIEIVDVPLTGEHRLDVAGIEAQFAAGVKHLLLCNPHNPLGRVFSRAELMELAEAADRHNSVVISDEIHAPLTFPGVEFVPYLSLGPAAERTGVLITSTSKSWNLAGLKAAFLVAAAPRQPDFEVLPDSMHYRSGLLGAFSMATAYSEGEVWLDSAIETIISARNHFAAELARLLPAAKLELLPEASYLAWVDVSGLGLGDSPADRILEEARVSVVAGPALGSKYTQHVRFNFATSHELITEALTRIASIVK